MLALPFLGFSALVMGLAIDTKEQGPPIPLWLEATYKQVAFEHGIDWALLAAWDAAEFGFALPVSSLESIFGEVLEQEQQTQYEGAKRRCAADPSFCPAVSPIFDPEHKELLWQEANRRWQGLIRAHIQQRAERIKADRLLFATWPETGYRRVLPSFVASRAADLYEVYLLLEQLDQHDDHLSDRGQVALPPDWKPIGGFVWPTTGTLSSRYGSRVSPIDGKQRLHAGIDLAIDAGTPVRASKAGVVVRAESDEVYGLVVILDHAEGYRSLYAHHALLRVTVGQQVQQGQIIGHAGSTGFSTGPHLHFEIHYEGAPVDPLLLLDQ